MPQVSKRDRAVSARTGMALRLAFHGERDGKSNTIAKGEGEDGDLDWMIGKRVSWGGKEWSDRA